MRFEQPTICLLVLLSIHFTYGGISNWNACSDRLERALDALHRDSIRRDKLSEEKTGTLYQRELRSVPLEMFVSYMAVKLPEKTKEPGGIWARVEQCIFEPERSSLRTRVVFNDLSVSGTVSLMPRNYYASIPIESCKMALRLRRVGIDFLTSPIARGRGQMRIRTESNFLEPRFASIYAYGCHTTRHDKLIKRQDKWPPYRHLANNKVLSTTTPLTNNIYDAVEPRQLTDITEEVEVVAPNENQPLRRSHAPEINFGIWRKNSWITKSSLRQRRSTMRRHRFTRTVMIIAPSDFADAVTRVTGHKPTEEQPANLTEILDLTNLTKNNNNKDFSRNVSQEIKELAVDDFDNLFPTDSMDLSRSWQSKEHITREMEDVFLQGASQTLTRYIERQLHPAIKETLMLSMGYTISYG